ncbi:hypothetical protein NFL61_23255 (plasmid) [Enterobacter ludwigii]|uniref:hypothetical protein n=1 Tax=Enterobacter TaxID=547 RepID=UPI00216AA516|nr:MULTISPECIES: hypothetical protein [Enterobacter]MCS3490864.1 hypothetical protein [Enterobacter sp. SLBN-59]WGC22709.1 hypothetical protein NFL61_23255 [Enterobacter ludwigii]
MFRLTCIELDSGEFAVYINHHYLGSEDARSERLCLSEIRELLSLIPGVELQTLHESVPEDEDWWWNDIADRVLPSRPACRDDVTVAGLIARLKLHCVWGRSGWQTISCHSMTVCLKRKLLKPCVSAITATMPEPDLTGTLCSLPWTG